MISVGRRRPCAGASLPRVRGGQNLKVCHYLVQLMSGGDGDRPEYQEAQAFLQGG